MGPVFVPSASDLRFQLGNRPIGILIRDKKVLFTGIDEADGGRTLVVDLWIADAQINDKIRRYGYDGDTGPSRPRQ